MDEMTELRKYLGAVLRWSWLLLLLTGIAALVSYSYSQRQERIYEATATVIVGQSIQVEDPDSNDIETSGRLAMTYATMIRRQPIMQAASDTLGLDGTWRGLRNNTSVYLIPGTQLIEITVRSGSPDAARKAADEVARQLILHTPASQAPKDVDETIQFVRERLARLKRKIEDRQAEIDAKEEMMINADQPAEKRALQNEINQLESVLSTWENNYSRLLSFDQTEESSNYVDVVEPAQARNSPVSPDVRTNTLLAAGVGVILSLLVIFLLEYVDDTVKTEEDLERSLGLIPLGSVAKMKGRTEEKLVLSQNPFSAASEAYRVVRSNIQFMSVDRPNKTVMITSAIEGEGKSITAANLGLVMAQAGFRTILVDADLRRPSQHEIFQVSHTPGLTDLLRSSEQGLQDLLLKTQVENLQILTSGDLPPNPSELLASTRMSQILERLSSEADIVILDSVPLLPVADSAVLANRMDGVVLVVNAGRTRRAELHKALNKLMQADAKIWGAVLNQISTRGILYYMRGAISRKVPVRKTHLQQSHVR